MSEFFVTKLSELLGKNEYLFVSDVIEFLGWLNVTLALIAGTLFVLRRISRHVYQNKNRALKKTLKPFSKIHPYLGYALVVSAYIHGDLALGTLWTLHTGTLAWWVLIAMLSVALLGKKYRVKKWLTVHRILAAMFVSSIVLHLFVRNFFG